MKIYILLKTDVIKVMEEDISTYQKVAEYYNIIFDQLIQVTLTNNNYHNPSVPQLETNEDLLSHQRYHSG